MSDPIERQEAIDAINDLPDCPNGFSDTYDKSCIIGVLEELPSAQPEIIRCEDCTHGVHSGRGDIYLCTVSPEEVREHKYDFYCGYAERRTD